MVRRVAAERVGRIPSRGDLALAVSRRQQQHEPVDFAILDPIKLFADDSMHPPGLPAQAGAFNERLNRPTSLLPFQQFLGDRVI